jgi:hypothetical protein
VVNDIHAELRFNEDGLINDHRDNFDFWKWSRQALGPTGLLLGWNPIVRNKVRQQAGAELDRFTAERRGG